jgi:ribonuclease HI
MNIVEKYYRAGQPWSCEENEKLIKGYDINNFTLLELCEIHKRMPGGIASRLRRLNCVKKRCQVRGYIEFMKSSLHSQIRSNKKELKGEKNIMYKKHTFANVITEVLDLRKEVTDLKNYINKLEEMDSKKNAFSILMAPPRKPTPGGYKIVKGAEEQEKEAFRLQFDGKSEPNPGPSSAGAVLYYPNSQTVKAEVGEYIPNATNNEAEYTGLLVGLHLSVSLGIKNLVIAGDSNLVINQVFGEWKVKSDNLKGLHAEIRSLFKNFDFIGAKHVYREHNDYADNITNVVFDKKKNYFKKDGLFKKTIIMNGVSHVLWSDEDSD